MKVEVYYNGELSYTGLLVSFQPDYAVVINDKTKFLCMVRYNHIKFSTVPSLDIVKPINSDMSQGV